jgi:acylglycerol lipase
VNHIEGRFKGVRDIGIQYQAWLPERNVKAVLILVHGLGEHCGRYGNVVQHFVPPGYAIYAMDHVGHGWSEGARESVRRFEDYTDTLAIFFDLVQGRQPGKPMFLLGHSMGGLIAFHSLLDHQARFQGAVLSAPSVKVSDRISRATIVVGRILSVLAPAAGVLALDPGGISRDPEVVSAYVNDPLVFHGKTPARLAAELLKAMLRVSGEAHRITLPIMVVQGGEDRLVDPAGAQMLHDRVGSRDKTLRVYEGLYHEVFNEPERDRVLNDVASWLEAHIRPE